MPLGTLPINEPERFLMKLSRDKKWLTFNRFVRFVGDKRAEVTLELPL
jgi:hypothetical protein